LTLGVAMVAFFVTLASTLTAGLADDATKALRADAVVTSVTPDFATVDPTLSTRLSAIDGVSVVAPTNRAEAKIDDGGARVGGIDPAAMAKTFDFGVTDGSLEPLVDGGIAVRTDGNVDDPKVGDSLVVQFTDAEVTLPVVATFSTTFVGFDAPTHLMDRRQLAAVTSGLLDVSIYLGLDPSIVGTADRDRVLAAVQDAVAATPGSLFETEKSFIAKSGDEIKGFRNFIYAMLGLCVLVALVGIANTMKLAIAERTHELGLLRAVGTTRRSVRRLVRLEAGLLAAVGSVVGVLVGSLLAWALLTVDGNARFGTVTWPIGTLVAVAIASVVAGVIAAARPAWVAAKVPVLDAIARR
jgi:putative ABC transport system permease protein